MKKLLSTILTIVFMFNIVPLNSFAMTTNSSDEITYSYNYLGDSVQETVSTIYDGETLTLNKIINPNNTYTLNIEYDGVTTTSTGIANYNYFKDITDRYFTLANTPMLLLDCSYYGYQYSHLYITSKSGVITNADLDHAETLAGYADKIAMLMGDIPLIIVTRFAIYVADAVEANTPYKVELNSNTYEVRTSYSPYDYLFHCYHNTIRYYDEGNHLLDIEEYTQQVIGGQT